jgi:protoporphyrinogen oxidase
VKIAVVGAGLAGMTAAFRLLKAGHQVDVYEAADYVGGLAAGFPVAGSRLEKYYHHIFTSDRSIRSLTDELGLRDVLHWLPSQMGSFYGGKVHLFGTPLQLLTFKPLPFLDRLRFGIVTVWLGRVTDWRKYEQVTAYEWVLKHYGPNVTKVIWEPLLRSKFGEDYDRVAMAWLWARIHTRASSREKGGTSEKLGYYKGGFDVLCRRLADAVRERGGRILLSTPVDRLLVEKGRFRGLEAKGRREDYDRLVFTAATPVFLKACPGLPRDYVERLTSLKFMAAQCLVLVMDRKFTENIYWLNITDPGIPFLAVVEHTNYVPAEWYGGKRLLYIGNYLPKEHRLFQLDKEALLREFLPHLKKINPDFDLSWVGESILSRDVYAQPVVPLRYSALKPDYETPVAGVYLANMSLVYPEDRGTNYAVQVGDRVAKVVDPSVDVPGWEPSPTPVPPPPSGCC